MDIPESIGAYKREVIMEYTTDGTDEWSYTRKEHLTRCRDCIHYIRDATQIDGYCHGKRKYETGYCDEAIRR